VLFHTVCAWVHPLYTQEAYTSHTCQRVNINREKKTLWKHITNQSRSKQIASKPSKTAVSDIAVIFLFSQAFSLCVRAHKNSMHTTTHAIEEIILKAYKHSYREHYLTLDCRYSVCFWSELSWPPGLALRRYWYLWGSNPWLGV